MTTKKWYQSKTIWSGVVVFFINVYLLSMPFMAQFGVILPQIPPILYTIIHVLLGITVVGGRATAQSIIE